MSSLNNTLSGQQEELINYLKAGHDEPKVIMPHKMQTGFDIKYLVHFIDNHKFSFIDMENFSLDLKNADDEESIRDVFKKLHSEVLNCEPRSYKEIILLLQLICIINLQKHSLVDTPLELLRYVLRLIPNNLRSDYLMEKVNDIIFNVSNDKGDRTFLCHQIILLGPKWIYLSMLLSWSTLLDILNANREVFGVPTISNLANVVSSNTFPKSLKEVTMVLHLVGILVNRCCMHQKKVSRTTLNELKSWFTEIPAKVDFNNSDGEAIIHTNDILHLQNIITDITVHWPKIEDPD